MPSHCNELACIIFLRTCAKHMVVLISLPLDPARCQVSKSRRARRGGSHEGDIDRGMGSLGVR